MAVQQNKVTRSRRNNRRSHDALKTASWVECAECGELTLPHHVCRHCGSYRGREILVAAIAEEEDEEL
ncbi:MAG: 50S ribosomal protein L32 [Rhodobacteraceae bacterium]|nr:50S ribosomal protein L32 [Paracoccaceae bacterium]